MTFFQLIRRNTWRKPLRTLLLTACVATTFLIYGLTASFLNGAQGSSSSSEDMLGVMNAAGIGLPLPLAYRARIASDPDVSAVAPITRLRGYVDTERNMVSVTATDPATIRAVNGTDLALTQVQIDNMTRKRDRVLVGRALADRQGWSLGQRIAITALDMRRSDGTRDWSFEIVGIFEGKTPSTDTYFILASYDYVNMGRARGKDTVNLIALRPRAGADVSALAARIDATFANSAAPTRTQSEKQFLQAFLRQYGDVQLIVNLVVGASFVTLLMIVINTMVFAIRERFFEIGVLKTLGFSRLRIVSMILMETLFVFAVGGLLGLGLTQLAALHGGQALGLVLSPLIVMKGVGLVFGLALITGFLPAFSAMRIPVVAAFRTR